MNKTFSATLTKQMNDFNNIALQNQDASDPKAGAKSGESDGTNDKIAKVRGEIQQVKQVMTDNIDRILDRGDKIELLVDKSQHLSDQVVQFGVAFAKLLSRHDARTPGDFYSQVFDT